MPHMSDRMALANPLWLSGAEEDFGRELDISLHSGELTAAQGEQLFNLFLTDEVAAENLFATMLQANLQAAATGQAPLLPVVGAGVPTAARPALLPGLPAVGAAPVGARGARGKVATLVVRQDPTGQVELLSTTPGRPALYQRDMTAAKRLKRVGKKISRLFPKRRSRRKVFKAAGSAIA